MKIKKSMRQKLQNKICKNKFREDILIKNLIKKKVKLKKKEILRLKKN